MWFAHVCVAQGLHTKVVEVPPQPLTVKLLARIPELSADSAQQLLQLFAAAGVTDKQGLLVEDPRTAGWQKVVQDSGIQGAVTKPTSRHVMPDRQAVCCGLLIPRLLQLSCIEHTYTHACAQSSTYEHTHAPLSQAHSPPHSLTTLPSAYPLPLKSCRRYQGPQLDA